MRKPIVITAAVSVAAGAAVAGTLVAVLGGSGRQPVAQATAQQTGQLSPDYLACKALKDFEANPHGSPADDAPLVDALTKAADPLRLDAAIWLLDLRQQSPDASVAAVAVGVDCAQAGVPVKLG